MIHQTGLDSLIFGSSNWEADSLVIISGYIGPNPVQRCSTLPFPVTVVYGMLTEAGISPADHEFFRRVSSGGGHVRVRYSVTSEVHAKLYLWQLANVPQFGFLGSANFTWPGLNSPGREILMDIPEGDLKSASAYARHVVDRSLCCLEPETDAYVMQGPALSRSDLEAQPVTTQPRGSLALVSARTGTIPDGSGINWGFANANVNLDDAYLPISVGLIEAMPTLIPARQANGNTPVELLWDDGEVMVGYLEGSQPVNGRPYPKQLASHPEKAILGRYLRRRLGVPFGTKVAMSDLTRYGRSNVDISLLAPGRYFLDFRAP